VFIVPRAFTKGRYFGKHNALSFKCLELGRFVSITYKAMGIFGIRAHAT
jgi:hypothetical protein